MTERERLAELIRSAMIWGYDTPDAIAERLLDEGVICPPCKVGDVVWMLKNQIERWKVASIEKTPKDIRIGLKPTARSSVIYVSERYIGEFIFLTREEAEAALAERRKKDHD